MSQHKNDAFRPNVHSDFIIKTEIAPHNETTKQLRSFISPTSEGPVLQIMEGMKSSNFIVQEFIGSLVYRQNAPEAKSAEIQWMAEFQRYLHEHGAPVPEPIAFSREGDTFVHEVDGRLWQRSEYVSGQHYHGTLGEMVDILWHLGKLHRILKFYPKASECPIKQFGSLDWEWWDECLAKIKSTASGKAVVENYEYLREGVKKVAGMLSELEGSFLSGKQLVHGDIHPQNLICADGKLCAFIDFGNMCIANVGMDIGNAIHRMVRRYVEHECSLLNQCFRFGDHPVHKKIVQKGMRLAYASYTAGREISISFLDELPVFMREILLRKMSDDMHLLAEAQESDEEALREINKFLGMLTEVDIMEDSLKS